MRVAGCVCVGPINGQLIGSTVSYAIVRSWLWLTATRSSQLGCFSTLLQVVVIDPTFYVSRFATGRLLSIEDFFLTTRKLGVSNCKWVRTQLTVQ